MRTPLAHWHQARLVLLSGFALLIGFAQVRQSLRPDASAHLEIVVQRADTEEVVPARVYLFKADKPFRLSPVESHLPLRLLPATSLLTKPGRRESAGEPSC